MSFHRRLILIYGDSLFLEGVSKTLQSDTNLLILTQKNTDDLNVLNDLHPDVVLVDAAQVSTKQVERLISAFPVNHSPPVICLEIDSQRLTVHSSQQFPARSVTDLERALEIILKSKQ